MLKPSLAYATGWSLLGLALSAASNAQLEEVIVTAEKREESLQDVSLSVQAFDAEALARGGIEDVTRIELLVPGVNYGFVGNDAKFNVRGANSSNTFSDNSSIVGTFVDGVYKPRASQQTRAFFDIDRVEFLTGPQGTLYGRNTFAGALNLFTNRPDLSAFSAGVNLGYERFETTRVEAFANVPLSETLGIRVAGFFENSDGHIENNAGPNLAARDDDGLRVSVMWKPSDNFDLYLKYSSFKESGTEAGVFGYTHLCRNVTPQGITDPFGTEKDCANPQPGSSGLPSADQIDPWEVSQDFVPNEDLKEDNLTVIANWDAGPVLVKSITGYSDFENLTGMDGDFSPNPHSRFWFDETAESYSQEIQILSNHEGPLQWTSGAYYSQDETFFSFSVYEHTIDENTRETVIGPNGEPFTLLTGTPIVSTATSLGGFFADSTLVEIETIGIFAQAEYALTDQLRFIGGLRYNSEEKDVSGGNNFTPGEAPVTVLLPAGASPTILPSHPDEVFAINPEAAGAIRADEKFTNTTWRAGMEYDFNDSDAMAYVTASTGFLSGSLNASGAVTDEQESLLLEIGLKSILLDGRLRFNVAGHYTEYSNLLTQIQVEVQGGNILTFSENGGEIDALGLEVDATYNPIDRLTLSLLASYLDSEYGTFGEQNPYQLLNGEVLPFVDVEGETTPWSPEFTTTLGISYEFPLGNAGTLTSHLQFFYSDEYSTSNLLTPDPNHLQDSFTKTDVRLIWDSPGGEYRVEGFIENIEDEGVLARGNNGGSDLVQTGFLYPRNYGLRVKLRF